METWENPNTSVLCSALLSVFYSLLYMYQFQISLQKIKKNYSLKFVFASWRGNPFDKINFCIWRGMTLRDAKLIIKWYAAVH